MINDNDNRRKEDFVKEKDFAELCNCRAKQKRCYDVITYATLTIFYMPLQSALHCIAFFYFLFHSFGLLII